MKMVVVWSFGTELFGDLGFGIRDLDKRSHWLYMVMFLDVAIPINSIGGLAWLSPLHKAHHKGLL